MIGNKNAGFTFYLIIWENSVKMHWNLVNMTKQTKTTVVHNYD